MTRYVVLAAVLAAGCEQLKSPQRISELEQRVEKLSNEVETMRGGPKAKKPGSGKHGAGSGSGEAGGSAAASKAAEPGGDGEAAGAGAGEAAHGGGEGGHGDGAPADGKGDGAADKEAAGHGEDGADKAADKPAHGEELPGEAKAGKEGGKEDGKEDGKEGGKDGEKDSAKDSDKTAGKDDGAHDGEGDKDKAKGKDAEGAAGGDGSGKDKELDKADKALAELRAVVAKSIQNGKQGETTGVKPAVAGKGKPKPEPPHWTYEGKTASPMWGNLDPAWKTCGDGKSQSPIDIQPKAGGASPITFHYQPTAATVVDNGHTLQVNLAPGSSIEINGGVYQLVQFHLHTPSEHTIAGERYPLEVHLVHQDSDGRLAVIGVMYDAGVESKPLGSVFAKWPRKGADEKLKKFDPSELLPQTRSVFRYTGSLTTPPCSEGVSWNVMRRAMTDSQPHLDVFTKHYSHNARDLQPLNDRKVE